MHWNLEIFPEIFPMGLEVRMQMSGRYCIVLKSKVCFHSLVSSYYSNWSKQVHANPQDVNPLYDECRPLPTSVSIILSGVCIYRYRKFSVGRFGHIVAHSVCAEHPKRHNMLHWSVFIIGRTQAQSLGLLHQMETSRRDKVPPKIDFSISLR